MQSKWIICACGCGKKRPSLDSRGRSCKYIRCHQIWYRKRVLSGNTTKCRICGKDFYVYAYKTKRNKYNYCSRECARAGLKKPSSKWQDKDWVREYYRLYRRNVLGIKEKIDARISNCETCGINVRESKRRGKHLFCSRKCYRIWWTSETEGRRTVANGYILVKSRMHPYSNKRGYIYEHRLVMENHIDRLLSPEEVVHHRNGDKKDNRIENLELFANTAEHSRMHGYE